MGRKKFTASEEQLKPDPRFGDLVLSRFINCVMQHGRKQAAQRLVYSALDEIERMNKAEKPAIEVFHAALENVKPSVEVRSKRVGGANYQVPMQVKARRRQSLAFRWIIKACRAESGKSMYKTLARELLEASRGEGKAMNTREQTHRMADANKAFAHFAW